MIFKKITFIITFILLIISAQKYSLSEETKNKENKTKIEKQNKINDNKEEYKEKSNKNDIVDFFKTYVIPEKNPSFNNKKIMFGLFYGFDYDRLHHKDNETRHLHNISATFTAPFKFLGLNFRTSIGLFMLFGKDQAAINKNEGKYHHLGIEIFPELVLGHKNLYVTAGCGVSYVLFGGPMTYDSKHEAEPSGIKQGTDKKYGHGKDGMTYFNFVLTANIGHSFDNGLAIEAGWKHYSNGGTGLINYDVNAFGISLKYAF